MDNDLGEEKNKLKVQYFGQSGYTPLCLLAIDAILNSGRLPNRVTVVSCGHGQQEVEKHLFLFWNWGYFPLTIVPSGFASGYSGEGAKGFSLAICMIRDKGIPLDGIYVSESEFEAIDQGQIDDIDALLLQKIKAKSEPLTFPWAPWAWEEDEFLLESGQLWRKFYWREQKADFITEAIADVDMYFMSVGRKLRLAMDKVKVSEKTEEWQSTGILIRDAWIEFTQKLCQKKNIETSDISPNDVKGMLGKLRLEDEIINLAKASFDFSLKTQHDRKISKYTAKSCVIVAVLLMQTLIQKYVYTDEARKKIEEAF